MAIRPGKFSTDTNNTTLYTKGGQYTLQNTGQEYRGPYHIKDGAPFTGKPKNPNAQPLLPFVYDQISTYVYDKLFEFKNPVKTHRQPKFFRPQPTPSDYNVGYFYRYVLTSTLDKSQFPIEISVSQANVYGAKTGIDAGLYDLHKIKWALIGSVDDYQTQGGLIPGIETQNRTAVAALLRRYPVMQFAFRNYTEFAQPTIF